MEEEIKWVLALFTLIVVGSILVVVVSDNADEVTRWSTNELFTYTAQDSLAGVGECYFFTNVSDWQAVDYHPFSDTMSVSDSFRYDAGAAAGTWYSWNVLCNDTVGNSNFSVLNYTFVVGGVSS